MEALLRHGAQQEAAEPAETSGTDDKQLGVFGCVQQRPSGQVRHDASPHGSRRLRSDHRFDVAVECVLGIIGRVPRIEALGHDRVVLVEEAPRQHCLHRPPPKRALRYRPAQRDSRSVRSVHSHDDGLHGPMVV